MGQLDSGDIGLRVASPSWFLIYPGGADICQPGNTVSWPDGPPSDAALDLPTSAKQGDTKELMGEPQSAPSQVGPLSLCSSHTHVSVDMLEVGGGSGRVLCARLGVALLLVCL